MQKTPENIMLIRRKSLYSWLILPVLLLAVVIAYLPGLHGPFVLDDGENITLNQAVAIERLDAGNLRHALTGNESGVLGRPLASLSFALNHYFAGGFGDSFPFKLTNLAIHLINTALLFILCILLTQTPALKDRLSINQRPVLALLATALWALHPLQLTSVLYVVQRMNSLSALFVMSGLILFLEGRLALMSRPAYGIRLMLVGVIGGTVLGLGAKENAALLPLLALVIEYTLFADDKRRFPSDRLLRRFYLLTAFLPIALCLAYLVIDPGFITSAYQHRSFSPFERLLTEARVLWFYLSLILFPAATRFSLFHDDLPVSTGLLTPPSTFIAIAGLAGILCFVFFKKRKFPALAFAAAWFLTGHLLESSILGLELVFEHRNYLPGIGIIFAAAYGMLRLYGLFRLSAEMKKITGLLIPVIVITFGVTTWGRANTWKDISTLAEMEVRYHPDSAGANDLAARVHTSDGDILSAIRYTAKGGTLSSLEAGFNIDLQILLAMLLPRIEPELKRLPPDTWRAGALQVENLPECVKAVKEKNGIRLVCATSSSEKIMELLRHHPVSVHAAVSLEELRRCLTDAAGMCQSLDRDAARWFAVAADNPRTVPGVKERILFNAALVHAHRQDYQTALQYLTRASELAPMRLSYQLGRVEYLIRMKRPAEAAALLRQATTSRRPNDREISMNMEVIQSLRNALGE